MNFTSLFLFFFGAVGVFNSFLVGLYFVKYKKPKQLSSLLFGIFLLFLSERAFRSLIYFFSDISPNGYSKFGPITFLFIGPFLLLYVLSVLKPTHKILRHWKLYIAFWAVFAAALHIIFPFRSDPIFYKAYILKAINFQWLIHILISAVLTFNQIKSIDSKKEKLESKNIWLFLLLIAVLSLWLTYFFISFNYFIICSIIFSVIFYSFFIYFLVNKKELAKVFGNGEKYISKKLDTDKAKSLTNGLKELMLTHKPYKRSNLKAAEIAKLLNITPHEFSQLLNDNLGRNFAVFINEYRVEEAKQLIRSNTKYTLDAIGTEAGFNSKSSFYTYFKSHVGMTPSMYRKQFLSSEL